MDLQKINEYVYKCVVRIHMPAVQFLWGVHRSSRRHRRMLLAINVDTANHTVCVTLLNTQANVPSININQKSMFEGDVKCARKTYVLCSITPHRTIFWREMWDNLNVVRWNKNACGEFDMGIGQQVIKNIVFAKMCIKYKHRQKGETWMYQINRCKYGVAFLVCACYDNFRRCWHVIHVLWSSSSPSIEAVAITLPNVDEIPFIIIWNSCSACSFVCSKFWNNLWFFTVFSWFLAFFLCSENKVWYLKGAWNTF